jgi:UDP-N-acetylglucosamine 4,6-dehydratase
VRVAITGGTGSLGRALVEYFLRSGSDRVVSINRCQHKRAMLERDFAAYGLALRAFVADVQKEQELVLAFRGCEAVVHAAALKRVDAVGEVDELDDINVGGTRTVIRAATRAGVKRVLFVSSDKATSPCNPYGATKLLAEYHAIYANAKTHPQGTAVAVVRYGNVLGSNGAVVGIWRDAVREGRPIRITEPSTTRFWLTLPDAVQIVQRALWAMTGGEVFVPMLPACELMGLAHAIGGDDYPIEALNRRRPGGEKLHEQLINEEEVTRTKWREDLGMYVVCPPDESRTWSGVPYVGEPVDAGLLYRSDVWPNRLNVEDMRRILEGVS